MKVLLIGNLAEDRQESMQRFTALLQSGLQTRGHEVRLLAPALHLARLHPPYRYGGLPKYLGYFDKFVLFPRELRRAAAAFRPDVVHLVDHSNAMYGAALGAVPILATCHDLLQVRVARGEVIRQSVGRIGRRYQEWIRSSLGRLRHVTCVSAATRTDVLRLTGLPPDQVTVIPNALNFPYQPILAAAAQARLAALAARQGIDAAIFDSAWGGFLLHVGGAHWYKNRNGVLAIYAALRPRLRQAPKLVLVGPPLTTEQAALAARLGIARHLVVLSGVTNPELEALYTAGEGLLFPSWAEGFGWPIAEAQACGCPVFASNRAPLTDVGGLSSVYFDPAEPVEAADVIAAAWPERASRRPAALAEAWRWNPDLMFNAYAALYRQLAPAP